MKSYRLPLIALVLSDALWYISIAGFANNYFTPLSLFAKYFVLFFLIYISQKSNLTNVIPETSYNLFRLLLLWNIITIIRGGFLAVDYWDWKFLLFNSGLFLLIPLAFYIGSNLNLVRKIFSFVLKYLFVFGFFTIPLSFVTNEELYARLMIPVSLFLLFTPYLKKKWSLLVYIVAATSIFLTVEFRANIIKIAFALVILLLYYLRRHIRVGWVKIARVFLFLLPLVLLFLGITRQYDLFKKLSQNDEYSFSDSQGKNESFTADTRTFLYVEVLSSLHKDGTMIIGEGGSGKYASAYFDYLGDGRGRYSSEVGFLNTMLYSGIIGALLYAAFLFTASYYAIYRSNNWLSKMLGLFIVCRWVMFFIEEFTQFDLNFFFFWLAIGLVSSRAFRMMTDNEIKYWLRGIFDKRYKIIKNKQVEAKHETISPTSHLL